MGVANILCLTGDGVQCGDQPQAKPVFDLDSIALLQTIRTMRDEGRFLSGRKLNAPPQVFLGAAVNPFAPPHDYRPMHFAKKIAAGAQFVQTQYCYDVPLLQHFMARVASRVCTEMLHPGRCRPAGLGQDRPLDAHQRAGRAYSRRHRRADEQAGPPKAQKAAGKQLASS